MIQILGACPKDLADLIGIIKWVINLICWVVPIILIVLCVLDIAKIVTAGNIDDKLKKEVTGRISTRVIFAILIFLVPTIVRILFRWIPVSEANNVNVNGVTWQDCWDGNVSN
jgi:hypothetical protein